MKPRLLDLFCGEGGCAEGYHRAGFEVVGIDIEPQPNYPFEFHRVDALEWLDGAMRDPYGVRQLFSFDAFHASPPCPSYSRALRHLARPQPKLIEPVREAFRAIGRPWVIENVPGAPLSTSSDLFGNHGVELCGTMFGLRVYRHRLFESSFALDPPSGCDHRRPALNPHNQAGRDAMYAEFGRQDPERIWRNQMGVEWMSRRGGRDAIPPAYTEFIGRQLLAHIQMEVAA